MQTDQKGMAEYFTTGSSPEIQFYATPRNGPYVPARYALKPNGGANFTVVLQKGQTVRGRILDRHSGAGVSRVQVSWQTYGEKVYGSDPVLTDADGRFEFNNAPAERLFIRTEGNPAGKSIEGERNTKGGSGEEVSLYLEDYPKKK